MFKLDPRLERARKALILALDVDTLDKAVDLATRLHPYVGMFKVGLELITAEGAPRVVAAIKEVGGDVFFDGKFDDIGNTVGNAAKQAAKMGVTVFNLHASAGMPVMLAAAANKGRSKAYAVTVLTSIDEEESNIVFGGPTKAKVLQMAREALLAGCDGIICSAQELKMLGKRPELVLLKKITPGIRPAFLPVLNDDQKRTMTPAEAIDAGADQLVIGRPITKPEGMTQEEAALKTLEEIATAQEKKLEEKAKAREAEITRIFAETEAIITDSHVVYTSGKHGEAYVNKDAIYPHTAQLSRLCYFIAEDIQDMEIDAVIGPVVGGVSLSTWTAHHLSILQGKEVVALCADKIEKEPGISILKRIQDTFPEEELSPSLIEKLKNLSGETLFAVKRGQKKFITGNKIYAVEDVLTTGTSARKTVGAAKEAGGEVVGLTALCNRGGITAELLEVPVLRALKNVDLAAFDEADCPYCKEGRPINTVVGKGADYLKNKS